MSKKIEKDVLVKPNRLNQIDLDDRDMKLSQDISQQFNDFAVLLKMDKANHFRIKAVQSAAEIVKAVSLDEYLKQDRLKSIKGIGKELSEKIKEFHDTGKCAEIEALKVKHPTWNAPKFDWNKKIDHNETAKYYWCFDPVDTNGIYGPENWSEEDAKEYGRPNVFVITAKKIWDEEHRLDSLSDKEMSKDFKTLFKENNPKSESDCVYSWLGSVDEFRKIAESSPLFQENKEIGPENEYEDYEEED